DWVRPAGRKDVIGKPIQYATTDNFLHHFNIQKLTDLPNVDELSSAGLIDTTTIDSSIFGTGKFYKERAENEKEDIYSNIEKAIEDTSKKD
ncbi:SMC-Scp complex subunit ScpB, partial [Pelagibacteraceae bacterium]|nr:SMC-Scp complex subunit ScpB [Pelagibacteraceae bacterium]